MHVSHQQIPDQLPADLQGFLADITRSLLFLANLLLERTGQETPVPAIWTHMLSGEAELCNTKHMCFSEK